MSILIEINEFTKKYNIDSLCNFKLVDMAIEKEFPEFEGSQFKWMIKDDRFLSIDIYDKKDFIKLKNEENYEEKCRLELIDLFNKQISKEAKQIMSETFNIPLNELAKNSVEKVKRVYGSYSVGLEKINDPNFVPQIDNLSGKYKELAKKLGKKLFPDMDIDKELE